MITRRDTCLQRGLLDRIFIEQGECEAVDGLLVKFHLSVVTTTLSGRFFKTMLMSVMFLIAALLPRHRGK